MNLALEFKLELPRCVQGESVFFSAALKNTGGQPVTVPSFHPYNRSLYLVARPERATPIIGLELGALMREHNTPALDHWEPDTVELPPSGKEEARGDILSWIGELPAGDYTLVAEYRPGKSVLPAPLVSAPVKLIIARAVPTRVSLTRLPELANTAPLAAIWRHDKPEERTWFFQEQSRVLPPNPYHALRVTDIPAGVEPQAAVVPTIDPLFGHILWTQPGKLTGLRIPADGPGKAAPLSVALPFSKAILLESARTTDEGGLWALLASEKRDELAFVNQKETGAPVVTRLGLDAAGPLGIYTLCWTFMDRLEFGWSREGGRDLLFTSMSPDDPAGSFAARQLGTASAPLLALDLWCDTRPETTSGAGYADVTGGQNVPLGQEADTPGSEPQPEMALFALMAETAPRRLVFARWRIPGGTEEIYGRVPVADDVKGALEVIQSVVSARKEPVYLLKDEAGRVYYASTQFETLTPAETIAGSPVTLEQQPSLHAASKLLEKPWVYLRFAPAGATGFAWAVVEPRGEASPYKLLTETVSRP